MEESGARSRERRKEDEGFIYNSWLTSFRSSPTQRGLRNGPYYVREKQVIDGILSRETSRAAVLCNPEDENQIFGWCVWEELPGNVVLHYVYVKHFARGNGLMGRMLRGVTGGRKPGDYLWTSHYPSSKELHRYFEQLGFVHEPDLINLVRLAKES